MPYRSLLLLLLFAAPSPLRGEEPPSFVLLAKIRVSSDDDSAAVDWRIFGTLDGGRSWRGLPQPQGMKGHQPELIHLAQAEGGGRFNAIFRTAPSTRFQVTEPRRHYRTTWNGRTWSPPVALDWTTQDPGCQVLDHPRRKGRLLAWCGRDRIGLRGPQRLLFVAESLDDGASWRTMLDARKGEPSEEQLQAARAALVDAVKRPAILTKERLQAAAGWAKLQFETVTPLPGEGGVMFGLFRSGRKSSRVARSDDQGASWRWVAPARQSDGPAANSFGYLAAGRVVGKVVVAHLIGKHAWISLDGGKTWKEHAVQLKPRGGPPTMGYPDLFAVMTSGGRWGRTFRAR